MGQAPTGPAAAPKQLQEPPQTPGPPQVEAEATDAPPAALDAAAPPPPAAVAAAATAEAAPDAAAPPAPAAAVESAPELAPTPVRAAAPPAGPALVGERLDRWLRSRVHQLRVQLPMSPGNLREVFEALDDEQLAPPFAEVRLWLGFEEHEPLPSGLERLVVEYRSVRCGGLAALPGSGGGGPSAASATAPTAATSAAAPGVGNRTQQQRAPRMQRAAA